MYNHGNTVVFVLKYEERQSIVCIVETNQSFTKLRAYMTCLGAINLQGSNQQGSNSQGSRYLSLHTLVYTRKEMITTFFFYLVHIVFIFVIGLNKQMETTEKLNRGIYGEKMTPSQRQINDAVLNPLPF